jgi:hypothetical protein
MTGEITGDSVSIEMSLPEYGVLSNLMGLAISLMQNDHQTGVEFAKELSHPAAETFAKMIVEGFAEITRGYKADTPPNGFVQ